METENTTIIYSSSFGHIVGTFTLVYCIPGLIVVVALLRAEIKYYDFNTRPFTILIVNALIADLVNTILFTFYAAPCDLFNFEFCGSVSRFLAGLCQSYAFYASLFTTTIMTINRFLVIFFPKCADRVFNKRGTYLAAVAAWIGSAFVLVLLDRWLNGCTHFYDEKQFIFRAMCDGSRADLPAVPLLSLSLMGVLYLMCLLKLKYDNSKIANEGIARSMARKRMKVFWQACGIWASVLLNVLGYNFISPYFADHILINGIGSRVLILCPTYGSCAIILIFDQNMRRRLQSVYKSNVIHTQTAATIAVQ